jgi:hypothetical protein
MLIYTLPRVLNSRLFADTFVENINMKKAIKLSVVLLSVLTISFTSCKKKDTTTTTNNTTTPAVTGNWNLNQWDGASAAGTLVFSGNNFTLNCTTFSITDNGTYTNSGSNYTFSGTGVMNGGNTWIMDTLTTNVLKMHSNLNLIVRATK